MAHPVTVGVGVGTQPSLRSIRGALRAARVTGFTTAWFVDHLMGFIPEQIWDQRFSWAARKQESPHRFYDPMMLLAHLAPRAGSVQLGVGVTDPIRNHPVMLARAALTASHLTRNPPILGLGAGERENIDPYGLSFERPVARLEEALQIIRTCFASQGRFSYEGEFWTLDDAVFDLRPGRAGVPRIWLGAHGERMLRLTGRFADGWYPSLPYRPEGYAAALATIADAATRAGRAPSEITPALHSFVVIGRTEARARAMLGHPAIRFMGLLAPASRWDAHGRRHPLGADFRGFVDFLPHRYSAEELWDAIAAVEPDFVAEEILWGDRLRIARDVRALAEAGLRHVVFTPVSALVSRSDAVHSVRSLAAIKKYLAD